MNDIKNMFAKLKGEDFSPEAMSEIVMKELAEENKIKGICRDIKAVIESTNRRNGLGWNSYYGGDDQNLIHKFGYDSLDLVELCMDIEKAFNITITDVEAENWAKEKGSESASIMTMAKIIRTKI